MLLLFVLLSPRAWGSSLNNSEMIDLLIRKVELLQRKQDLDYELVYERIKSLEKIVVDICNALFPEQDSIDED